MEKATLKDNAQLTHMNSNMTASTIATQDPFPSVHGVLLSDYIRAYSEHCALIEGFNAAHLQPSSYELHVGNDFYINNKRQPPDANGEVFIPPNGLMYFSIRETINLPPYIVAIHDLRVSEVYRGLLVGRSVYVQPGYRGQINYPIFNFTSQPRSLRVGDAVGTIIFIKTTPCGTLSSATEPVVGVNGYECLQATPKKSRPIPEYWKGGETHTSAVLELETQFQKLKDEITKYRNLALVGFLALFLTWAIGTLVHTRWVSDYLVRTSERAREAEDRVRALNEADELSTLSKRITALEGERAAGQNSTGTQPSDAGQ